MNNTHIVTSFDEDLNKVSSLVLQMGGMVELQIKLATEALIKDDVAMAKTVIRSDGEINRVEAEINELTIQVLALRQPVAQDLRSVVMTLKIAGHLERMGDYTKNIARRTRTIAKAEDFTGSFTTLQRMSELVQNMIKMALDCYTRNDVDVAEEVRAEDESVDQLHNTLFRELLTYMMEDPRNISACMHLLFIAKNFEKMGDHAVEMAQEVIYLVTGKWPEDKRAKGDRTSRMIFTPEELAGS